MDTVTTSIGEIELEDVEYHKLIHEALMKELRARQDALISVSPEELGKAQGRLEELFWFLKLPQKIVKESKKKSSGSATEDATRALIEATVYQRR